MDVKEIISQSIMNEEKAYFFYKDLANSNVSESSKVLFMALAEEEKTHKMSLIKLGDNFELLTPTKDLKLLEKLMLTPINEMGELIKNLKSAIKKEDASYKAYNIIARNVKDKKLMILFEKLTREELRHKTMLENEIKRLK